MEARQRRTPAVTSAGRAEEFLLYPAPNIRITKVKDAGGNVVTKVNTLHMDGLGSVRAATDEAGLAAERSTYRPFGPRRRSSS
ncbi:MAG: hypothetical protein KDE03_14415 [Rhodobacteraceae bacterium]|nr:hypothetical protein [Paracoccaceae bacterium]